jgi:hypothetical protein
MVRSHCYHVSVSISVSGTSQSAILEIWPDDQVAAHARDLANAVVAAAVGRIELELLESALPPRNPSLLAHCSPRCWPRSAPDS